MSAMRGAHAPSTLIVNGDDFGQSRGINLGIIEAHERGVLTSASLMVHGQGAAEAAALARRFPGLGVGLHLDIGEWVWREDQWVPLYQIVSDPTHSRLAEEVKRQAEAFFRLMDRPPTHIDSHQHVHRDEPLRSLLGELADALGVPLREQTGGVTYCGRFYGQTGRGEPLPEAITLEAFIRILESLGEGVTEVACHPGREVDFISPYSRERQAELAVLCDARVRQVVRDRGLRLCAFGEALNRAGDTRGVT